jgi:ATP-dependent Clp protease ATP-binding subunit ClpA
MMFERFTDDARAVVIKAQEDARRLGHRYIGCEHLLLAVASADRAASMVMREHGVTPERAETEIVRLVELGTSTSPFGILDREALASIGIDLDAVRAKIEATFGPDALAHTRPVACRRRRHRWLKSPMVRLSRRRRRRAHRVGLANVATPRPSPRGHIPFTDRAKKSMEYSLREAKALHDNHIGVEHLALALVTMKGGMVPSILSALGTSQPTLRAAILDRYRRAS